MTEFNETVQKALEEAYQNGRMEGLEALRDVAKILETIQTLEELEGFKRDLLRALGDAENG